MFGILKTKRITIVTLSGHSASFDGYTWDFIERPFPAVVHVDRIIHPGTLTSELIKQFIPTSSIAYIRVDE